MSTGTVIGLVSTAFSINEQRGAARDARRANELERARARQENIRKRRQTLAEARIKQGLIAQGAVSQGVQRSSVALGASSNLAAQAGSSIGFQQSLEMIDQQRFDLQRSMYRHQSNLQTIQAAASFAQEASKDLGF